MQCVPRSLMLPIGMLSIMMAGGVYCALSTTEAKDRLCKLIKQVCSSLL